MHFHCGIFSQELITTKCFFSKRDLRIGCKTESRMALCIGQLFCCSCVTSVQFDMSCCSNRPSARARPGGALGQKPPAPERPLGLPVQQGLRHSCLSQKIWPGSPQAASITLLRRNPHAPMTHPVTIRQPQRKLLTLALGPIQGTGRCWGHRRGHQTRCRGGLAGKRTGCPHIPWCSVRRQVP